MTALPTITALSWVPDPARGLVKDLRARWAFEEVGQAYEVELFSFDEVKGAGYRRRQPFGQVPTYRDGEVEIFESGAIVLRIAERGGGLLPADPGPRHRAIQWLMAALNSVEPWIMQYAAVISFEADRPWSAMRRDSVLADLERRLGDLDAALGDQDWLDGRTFTAGDLVMVSVLRILRRADVLPRFPRLAAYVQRAEARPAFQKALADQLAAFTSAQAA